MNSDTALFLLAARRRRLIVLAQAQRLELGAAAAPLVQGWQRVEQGLLWWQRWRASAWIVLLPAAALMALRPRAAARAATGLWTLWRGARSVQRLLNHRARP